MIRVALIAGSIATFMSLICAPPALAADELRTLAERFPELKVAQDGGLPTRFAHENWSQAQQLVATDDAWRQWLSGVRSSLDAWIAKPREQAEWVGGYMHALVDPSSGQPVKWTSDMPEPPRRSTSGDAFHDAWVAWVRTANIDRILEASRLFRLTGETRYAVWAASQIDLYAENYLRWPMQTREGKSRMFAQALDEATAIARLVPAVRLLRDHAGAERVSRWKERLFYPIVDNLRASDVGLNNISLWHAAAMTEVGLLFADEPLVREGLDGSKGIRTILKTGVTADFIWFEGSLGYQTYILRALSPLFIEASLLGRGAELRREMLIAQNMLLAPLALRFDDGMLPNPGDSSSRIKALDLGFMLEMYRTLPTRIGLIEASRKKSWNTLIDPPEVNLSIPARLPAVTSIHLDSIRMAVLKANGWQVFHRYGQLTRQHAQEDALNTEIYLGDTPVSTNQATVLYESPLHKNYFRKAVAHNVPLVDGQGQIGSDPGNLVKFDPANARIATTQPRLRPGVGATREIAIVDGALRDRLSIRLGPEVTGSKRLGFLFHAECNLDSPLESASPAHPPLGDGFAFWEQTTQRDIDKPVRLNLRCAERPMVLEISASGAGTLYTALAPATPLPRKRRAVYVEIIGREAFVEMKFVPQGTATRPQ